MSVKLLTEHHLEFVSLKGGCTGSSESTLVKMPHCWKTHATAHIANSVDPDQTAPDLGPHCLYDKISLTHALKLVIIIIIWTIITCQNTKKGKTQIRLLLKSALFFKTGFT